MFSPRWILYLRCLRMGRSALKTTISWLLALTPPGQSSISITQRPPNHQHTYRLWYYTPLLSGSMLRQRGIQSGFQSQESKLKSFGSITSRLTPLRLLLLVLGLLLTLRAINSVIGSTKSKLQSKDSGTRVSNLKIKLIGLMLGPRLLKAMNIYDISEYPLITTLKMFASGGLSLHSKETSRISLRWP